MRLRALFDRLTAGWRRRPAPADVAPLASPAPTPYGRAAAGNLKFRPQLSCENRQVASILVLPERQLNGDTEAILRAALKQSHVWVQDGLAAPPLVIELPKALAESAELAQPLLWELDRQNCVAGQVIFSTASAGHYSHALNGMALLSRHGCGIELDCLDPLGMALIREVKPKRARMRVPPDFLPDDLRHPKGGQLILSLLALAERHGLATLVGDVRSRERFDCLAQTGFDIVEGDAVAPVLDADATAQFLDNTGARAVPHDRLHWPAA